MRRTTNRYYFRHRSIFTTNTNNSRVSPRHFICRCSFCFFFGQSSIISLFSIIRLLPSALLRQWINKRPVISQHFFFFVFLKSSRKQRNKGRMKMHHLRVHQISFFPRRTRESSISISLTIAHQTVPSIFNIFTPCIHLHGCTMKKKQRINIKKNKIKLLIHFVCRRTHIRCVLYIVFLSFIFSLSMIN